VNIGELFISIGVNADNKTLNDFIGDLGQLKLASLSNIASIAGMTAELIKLGTEATNIAIGFQMFTNQTGLSSQELQRWQLVAQQANVSAEAVAGSVSALQRNLAEIKLGRGNISPFQMLGISPRGNAFDVLTQLRGKMGKYDAATMTNLAAQMGITPDMINLLRLSNDEFAKLAKTTRGLTTEQQTQFLKTKQSLVSMGLEFKYFGIDVAYHFLTAMEGIINSFRQLHFWWPGIIAAVVALGVAFAPIATAALALLAVFEDLAVYARGGNSVFGLLEKKYIAPGANKAGSFLEDHLPKWLTDFLVNTGSAMAGVPAPAGGPKNVTNNINVNVHGNGPPEAIADATAKRLAAVQNQLDNQGH